jgi:hypothetical protein
MRFREHLSWSRGRNWRIQDSPPAGEAAEIRTPLDAPRTDAAPPPRVPSPDGPGSGGSTTLFYRLKGLITHASSKVDF